MKEFFIGLGGVLIIIGLLLFAGRDMFKSRQERYRNTRKKWGKLDYIGLGLFLLGIVIAALANIIG